MNRYSDKLMEHFQEPQNRGTLPRADGVGVSGTPGAGPYFVFQIMCRDGLVVAAAFQSHTCGVTVASGSVLTTLVLNKSLRECQLITAQDIAAALDGVPPDKVHIPEFALRAMQHAIVEAIK